MRGFLFSGAATLKPVVSSIHPFPFTKHGKLGATALSGSVLKRRLADDSLVVDVKIRGERRTLGPVSDWSEKRARNLLERRLLPAARLRQEWAAVIAGVRPDGAGLGTLAGSLMVREARNGSRCLTTGRRYESTVLGFS